MSSHKQKKHSMLKKAVSIAVMGSICLTAAVSVAAFTQTVKVTDGKENVTDDEAAQKVVEIGSGDAFAEDSVGDSVLNAFNAGSTEDETSIEVTVKESDKGAFSKKEKVSNKEVTIDEWRSIKVNLRGKEISKDVPAGTVADALAYLNIKLTDKDSLNVDKKTVLKDGDKIVITRTVVLEATEKEVIKFKKVEKKTSTLFEGETKVETEGSDGEKTITVEKKYVNGKLVSKTEISSEVTEEAVDEVVLKGTAKKVNITNNTDRAGDYASEKPASSSDDQDAAEDNGSSDNNSDENTSDNGGQTFTDSQGNTVAYKEVLTGSGTAYYADAGALTATGRRAQYGVVAVNPNIIPYGSQLYIVSNDGQVVYGYAVAGDTGGALMDGSAIVDLFYPTYDECCQFGRRDVTIYVVEYGNEYR